MVFWDNIYSLLQNVKSHVYSGMKGTWNVVSLNVSYDGEYFLDTLLKIHLFHNKAYGAYTF
jgi:hypothetical protein